MYKFAFTLGAIAGVSSLALAVPLLSQVTNAASGTVTTQSARPVPSQECVQALADHESAMLDNIDAMAAAHKAATLAHRDALAAAAQIADDAERQTAVKKANDDLRTAMKAAMGAEGDHQADMDKLKAACGDSMPFPPIGFGPMDEMHGHGPHGKFGKGDFLINLSQKFGMTEDELKAELKSGKTMPQIAQEHGVDVPDLPDTDMKHHFMRRFRGADNAEGGDTPSNE